ncbi:DUF6762 family protein [Candidatus Clostridium radicumherbarum]|uniref:DUF6762 family protein n=1 Tax=Candidatus Clostridium radicumherbarum TaxID=3381662 RepID=A0ABW8TT75_9CLOT
MDFSSLVLMERDKDTNFLVKELGSYEVSDGAQYVTKFFYQEDKVNMFFDTAKDVEEWEYTAIYDLFSEEEFINEGFSFEQVDDEYNPTWLLKFNFSEDHLVMQEIINKACNLIDSQMLSVFKAIEGKEEEYK